jgi:hypothetical protein
MEKVKFYSINDMTYGHYLRTSESLIKEYEAGKEAQDINYVIELYNVKKYFDKKIFLTDWSADDVNRYENVVKTFLGIVVKFFKSITDDNLMTIYLHVDLDYTSDFWELIEKFKVYESISQGKFKEILDTSKVWLYELMKYKHITEHFGVIIRVYMLNDSSSAELLLDKYELKHNREKEAIFFPKELSNADKETIICNYIDSENPNLNYLRLISNIQRNKDKLEISPKTLLKAKRKVEDQEKHFFKEDSGMVMESTVSFSKSQIEEVALIAKDHSISATYSTKWLEENQEYATLLNNYIYLFDFVDKQMRSTLVNKFNEMGVFERFIVTSSQNAYTKGIAFDQKNILSLLQMVGYYNQLFSMGIRLEEVVEWFFEEYLDIEFDAHNFRVTMPSANSTLLEKCTNIMPALESVLKQFSLFVQEGQIDFELLDIRSEHLIYKNIPSLIERKYVYGVGEEFKTATFLLFSDQSGLGYNEKKRTYNNFFDLIRNEKIKLNDYPDYYISRINWLLDNKYLDLDGEASLIFNNVFLIRILKDLYFNEVISYWRYSEYERKVIDDLEKKKVIEFECTLFSRPEQDYFNYNLNKSQFNNGLDLRNKYSHTQPKSGDEEMIHNQNYMIFLRLFIISIIKINDEFCISEKIRLLE